MFVRLSKQSSSFCTKYVRDVNKVFQRFTCNPYVISEFRKINTSLVLPETVAVDSKKAFEISFPLYVEYVKTRFTERTSDIIDTPIKKNSLKLPIHLASVTLETPKIKVKASTLIKLRVSCGQVRE